MLIFSFWSPFFRPRLRSYVCMCGSLALLVSYAQEIKMANSGDGLWLLRLREPPGPQAEVRLLGSSQGIAWSWLVVHFLSLSLSMGEKKNIFKFNDLVTFYLLYLSFFLSPPPTSFFSPVTYLFIYWSFSTCVSIHLTQTLSPLLIILFLIVLIISLTLSFSFSLSLSLSLSSLSGFFRCCSKASRRTISSKPIQTAQLPWMADVCLKKSAVSNRLRFQQKQMWTWHGQNCMLMDRKPLYIHSATTVSMCSCVLSTLVCMFSSNHAV